MIIPILISLLADVVKILVLAGVVYLLLDRFLKNPKRVSVPAEPTGQSIILPLKLQAFERFVLFLERIHPSNLVMRLNAPGLTAMQFQGLMIRTIREEFEYNLSQQLYISAGLWETVKNAREDTVALIHQAAGGLDENASADELVRQILAVTVSGGKLPVESALDEIRREMNRVFS